MKVAIREFIGGRTGDLSLSSFRNMYFVLQLRSDRSNVAEPQIMEYIFIRL